MEVHHHPHVGKKNFKEYFLEFLMIFMAVTLGFIAENIREHITEHKNARNLAISLYNDLQRDTAALNQSATFRSSKMLAMDSLFLILDEHPGRIKASLFFHLILPAFSSQNFKSEQSVGALTQLKNAGYLRYYTHSDIPLALAAYESSVGSLSEMEKLEQEHITEKGFAFLLNEVEPALFNQGYSESPFPEDKYVVPRSPDLFRSLYSNCVVIGILNRNIAQRFLVSTKEKAVELMNVLRKEYHIK